MRRRVIFIIIAFIVLVGLGVAVLYAVNRSPALQNAVYKVANKSNPANTVVKNTNIAVVKPTVTPDRESILFVARNFSETYGSFSNQNNGSNLIAAIVYATDAYATSLKSQAAAVITAAPATEYNGTVTKSLSFNVISQSNTAAQVVVSTQQTVTTGVSSKTQTKDLLVDFSKVGTDWKVNAAVWK